MERIRYSRFLVGAVAYFACASFAFSQTWQPASSQQLYPAPPVAQAPVHSQAQPMYAQSLAAPESLEEQVQRLSLQVEQLSGEMQRKANVAKPSSGFSAPKISGRFFIDRVDVLHQNDNSRQIYGEGRNLFRMREARITATGTGYGFLDYKFELGYESGNDVSIKDMFLGISNVPYLEYVRVGNQYVEDAGSEICNGTTNYTFMEAPAPAGGFFTSRRVGITSRHLFDRDRGRLFFGLYEARDISGGNHTYKNDSQGVILNARYTYAPMFSQDGRCMFLYGAYYSLNTANEQSANIRPGNWNVYDDPLGVRFDVDASHKAGFEIVYQNDRFCFQTDLFLKHYSDIVGVGDSTNYGGFVMGSYFLTSGDYRKYNLKNASWGGVSPCRPFMMFSRGGWNCVQGPGAWEVAAMYSFLDTNDLGFGNDLTEHQLGLALNWYWNSQVRWSMNYIHQTTDFSGTGKGKADLLGLTCRVSF